ncbi:MAG: CpaF family protein [Lachnospiraceae bacterium]|nr:CpaF family protein [Lachnospiraceae bacterium]
MIKRDYVQIKKDVFDDVCDRLVRSPGADDTTVLSVIRDCIIASRDSQDLTPRERSRICHELFNRIRGLDVLQDIIEDDSVTEIMVNGTDEIFVERYGRLSGCGLSFESKERLTDIIGKIASGVNRTINLSSPILDARLADGSRVNAVLDPIAINGPSLTIRRFPNRPMDADALVATGSVSRQVLDFLRNLVISGYNMLISGSTGCGKTTFLNVLSSFIPHDERVITIEDSAELRIMGIRNLVRLETRNATAGGCGQITIRDLIRNALRMRPDRVIVGEVRGEEAIDMLQAFNVGEDGSLSTIHANSAGDAISRLETMIMLSTNIPVEALRRQIASGVDIIIHLGRLRDKSRHVLEISEVVTDSIYGIGTRTLYSFEETGSIDGRVEGELVFKNRLENREKMIRAGLYEEEE